MNRAGYQTVDFVLFQHQGAENHVVFQLLTRDRFGHAFVLTQFDQATHIAFANHFRIDDFNAGAKLHALGAKNVVIKGQHIEGQTTPVRDFVSLADGKTFWLEDEYVPTDRVNGTGDTFSAIIAAELAKGHSVETGVRLAKKVVHEAIANEIEVGHKFGPINHWAGQEAAN